MKCVMIINPKSGHGFDKKNSQKFANILKSFNYEYEILFTKYRGHATEIIQQLDDSVDLVISAGGDGTFSEVMNGNLKRKKKFVLSHLPVGTLNDIGHMYGLVNNMYTNLKLILAGEVKSVDVGLINNHAFTYVASFGKFMEIPYKTPQELKKRLGFFAYALEVLKRIYERIPKIETEFIIDGKRHAGMYTFIIISNANRIAGINNFYRDMKLDDGNFEVMLCSLSKKTDILKAFYNLKTNNLSSTSGVECYKCSNLKIKFKNTKKAWCCDGEEFNDKSGTYKIELMRDVKLMLPKKNIKKLFISEEN
ncbi:MAG: YegS/Rv2252/BmrU family lipid kinase [Bacilli bacterium]|nr:YegS/Rv2252/BmrU family lipid kinase [Bacilli bacterium]